MRATWILLTLAATASTTNAVKGADGDDTGRPVGQESAYGALHWHSTAIPHKSGERDGYLYRRWVESLNRNNRLAFTWHGAFSNSRYLDPGAKTLPDAEFWDESPPHAESAVLTYSGGDQHGEATADTTVWMPDRIVRKSRETIALARLQLPNHEQALAFRFETQVTRSEDGESASYQYQIRARDEAKNTRARVPGEAFALVWAPAAQPLFLETIRQRELGRPAPIRIADHPEAAPLFLNFNSDRDVTISFKAAGKPVFRDGAVLFVNLEGKIIGNVWAPSWSLMQEGER